MNFFIYSIRRVKLIFNHYVIPSCFILFHWSLLLCNQELVGLEYLVGNDWHFYVVFVQSRAPAGNFGPRSEVTEFCKPIWRLLNDLVFAGWLAFKMHDVECVFVHLLNDEDDLTDAPNVIHVSHVYLWVDIEFAHLTLLLRLRVLLLPIKPVCLDGLIFRILDQLVDDIIYFKTDALRLVSDDDTFHSVEVTYEAGLLNITKLWLLYCLGKKLSLLTSLKSK